MNEPEKPKRPRWRKKRWWAATLAWLAVGYPLLLGPFTYAHFRGWVSAGAVLAAHEPVRLVLVGLPQGRFRDTLIAYNGLYVDWWVRLAEAAPAPRPISK